MVRQMIKREWIILTVLMLVYAVVFTVLSFLRYRSYFAEVWEGTAICHHIVWNIAHGYGPYTSITNSVFYQHPAYIYFPVALLYALRPHITTLYGITSLLFASAMIPVFLLARKALDSWKLGLYFCVLYAIFPPIYALILNGFRPILLSAPLLIWTFYFYKECKFVMFLFFAFLCMGCYETITLNIAFFGIYALYERKPWRWVIVPLALGFGGVCLYLFVAIPALGHGGAYFLREFAYHPERTADKQVWNLFEIIRYNFVQPLVVLKRVCDWDMVRVVMGFSGFPFLLLPYCAPTVLLIIVPTYIQTVLQTQVLSVDSIHQIAPIPAMLMVASIYGCQKCLRYMYKEKWRFVRIVFLAVIGAMVMLANFGQTRIGVLNGHPYDKRFYHVRNILDPVFYTQDAQDRIADELIGMIPPEAIVATSGDLLPQLSHRRTVYEFGIVEEGFFLESDKEDLRYLDADYILLRTRNIQHGSSSNNFNNDEAQIRADDLVARGIFEYRERKGDFILLQKRRKVRT